MFEFVSEYCVMVHTLSYLASHYIKIKLSSQKLSVIPTSFFYILITLFEHSGSIKLM